MATKTRSKKGKPKSKRKGVMTTLAEGVAGLYGRVKHRLARKKPKAPAKKPAAKPRGRRRTRKA